jgi:YVTN family beta-propeller protein
VIKSDVKAYISSQRDEEVVLDLTSDLPTVKQRIVVGHQPNKMVLNRAQTRLYVENGNSDSVSVIDTAEDKVVEEIDTTAPKVLFPNRKGLKGSNPNSLALSPNERFLYVTNGGTNSEMACAIHCPALIQPTSLSCGILLPKGSYSSSRPNPRCKIPPISTSAAMTRRMQTSGCSRSGSTSSTPM